MLLQLASAVLPSGVLLVAVLIGDSVVLPTLLPLVVLRLCDVVIAATPCDCDGAAADDADEDEVDEDDEAAVADG